MIRKVQQAIMEMIPIFLEVNGLRNAQEINKGWCQDFAEAVIILLENENVYGEWMNDYDTCHYVIILKYNGRKIFFDSECPQGTLCPFNLPILRR